MPQDRRSLPRITVYRAEVPGEAEPHEASYDSVADALHFACRDLRSGRRRPLEILENGALALDAEAIRRECGEEHRILQDRLHGAADAEGA